MTYNSSQIFNYQNKITEATKVNFSSLSYLLVEGSDITYTPDPTCDYVVYNYFFYYGESSANKSGPTFKLQSGTNNSYSDITGAIYNCGHYQMNFKTQANIVFILPIWSGEKQLRVIAREYVSGYSHILHATDEFDNSSTTKLMYPHLEVYSIRNSD